MLAINSKSERSVLAAYQAGAARLELKEHAAASQHFYKVVSQGSRATHCTNKPAFVLVKLRVYPTNGLTHNVPTRHSYSSTQ